MTMNNYTLQDPQDSDAWLGGDVTEPKAAPIKGDLIMHPHGVMSSCKGREEQWVSCSVGSCSECTPVDCVWEDWSPWGSLGGCTGLGARHREVVKVNNECGKPCDGIREETVARDEFLKPECREGNQDCIWEEWGQWSHCGNCEECPADRLAQSIRMRRVLRKAIGHGSPCEGAWNHTRPCGKEVPQDCALTEWGPWTDCSASCGGGYVSRMRRVKSEAENGGQPCFGELRVMQSCNEHACEAEQDCEVGSWEDWAGCDAQSQYQMTRQRSIIQYASGASSHCNFALHEIAPCLEPEAEYPWCRFTDWSAWSRCPVTCGGGQQERMRGLDMAHADCKAMQRAAMREVRGCSDAPCGDTSECSLSHWSSWSACSQRCGPGVATRSRSIKDHASNGGETCVAALTEMKECSEQPCRSVDCRWSEWEAWSECTATCGGGATQRSRTIEAPPREGGMPCSPLAKSQVAPCSTDSCDYCVDGAWSSWDEWSQCTATCGASYRWRHRAIAQRQNHCGKPAVGREEEYEMCGVEERWGVDEDCELTEWTAWGSCSCSCFGVMERHRHVAKYAKGNGRQCSAETLKEVSPCHPGPDEDPDPSCLAKVDSYYYIIVVNCVIS